MQIWIRKIVISIIVGIGVGLAAASIESPTGTRKLGYTINPYFAGSGAGLIIFGASIGRRKVKKKPKPKDDEEGFMGKAG